MDPTHFDHLKLALKKMVVSSCNVEGVRAEEIEDHLPIINGPGKLKLDSLDALEIVMGIERNFGIKFESANATRKLFKSFDDLTAFLVKEASLESQLKFLGQAAAKPQDSPIGV